MKRFNINLPDEIYEAFRKKAYDANAPISAVMVLALRSVAFDITAPIDPKLQPLANEIAKIHNTEVEKQFPMINVVNAEEESPKPELAPICQGNGTFCRVRSTGQYKIITDAGENERQLNLCVFHWNQARREGEVREVQSYV